MNMQVAIATQGDIAFQSNLYDDPNPTRRGLHRRRRQWVENAIDGMLAPQGRILEVGIGCGIFTRFLSDRGAEVTAVDINAEFVAGIAGLRGVHPMLADATEPLPIGPQDLALCSEVLEHVPPSRSLAMLRSIHGALAPGGRLILTTPQRFSAVELMARLLNFRPVLALARKLYGKADALGHVNLLTATELKRQIAQAGFVIEAETLFGFYLPIVAEFGGAAGWRLLRAMERAIARMPGLRALIWTQAYILRKS